MFIVHHIIIYLHVYLDGCVWYDLWIYEMRCDGAFDLHECHRWLQERKKRFLLKLIALCFVKVCVGTMETCFGGFYENRQNFTASGSRSLLLYWCVGLPHFENRKVIEKSECFRWTALQKLWQKWCGRYWWGQGVFSSCHSKWKTTRKLL